MEFKAVRADKNRVIVRTECPEEYPLFVNVAQDGTWDFMSSVALRELVSEAGEDTGTSRKMHIQLTPDSDLFRCAVFVEDRGGVEMLVVHGVGNVGGEIWSTPLV